MPNRAREGRRSDDPGGDSRERETPRVREGARERGGARGGRAGRANRANRANRARARVRPARCEPKNSERPRFRRDDIRALACFAWETRGRPLFFGIVFYLFRTLPCCRFSMPHEM